MADEGLHRNLDLVQQGSNVAHLRWVGLVTSRNVGRLGVSAHCIRAPACAHSTASPRMEVCMARLAVRFALLVILNVATLALPTLAVASDCSGNDAACRAWCGQPCCAGTCECTLDVCTCICCCI